MKEFTYCFNQLGAEFSETLFMNYEHAQSFGGVKPANYITVDRGRIKAANEEAACEKLFWLYNKDKLPCGYRGRSMSVSDIVELVDFSGTEEVKTIWYCDSVGFRRIDEDGNKI